VIGRDEFNARLPIANSMFIIPITLLIILFGKPFLVALSGSEVKNVVGNLSSGHG